ncbi:hypothetical protein [Nocardia sp. 348MFTsu5.1]|nr:hypothetical protein [Nocardia sp. 348MFTsu5.1]
MSDWVHKIKEEAKEFLASAEQELTVLEGVDGVDPLDHRLDDEETPKEPA